MANDVRKLESLNDVWPEWQIVSLIGKGGFGAVYKAERKDREERINYATAVKVITVPSDESEVYALQNEGLGEEHTIAYFEETIKECKNEIAMMVNLKNAPHIVSIDDYQCRRTGLYEWKLYIRMELLTPFTSCMKEKVRTEQDVIRLGCQICRALENCHKKQIFHRDIKPENIFVDDYDQFKLGDFGIARRLENATAGFTQKGSYNYMAPEVFQSREYDERADLYSLGIVLYRLLNSNLFPFINSSDEMADPIAREHALGRRKQGEALPPPRKASDAVSEVILKACAPKPEDRYRSAIEMRQALESVQDRLAVYPPLWEPVVGETDERTKVIGTGETTTILESREKIEVTQGKTRKDINKGNKEMKRPPKVNTSRKVMPALIALVVLLVLLIGVTVGVMITMQSNDDTPPASDLTYNEGSQLTYPEEIQTNDGDVGPETENGDPEESESNVAGPDSTVGPSTGNESSDSAEPEPDTYPEELPTVDGTCGTSLKWEYDPNIKLLRISGEGEMDEYESHKEIPWYIYRDKIRTIIVEEGVTKLSNNAFWGNLELKSMSWPSTLVEIGSQTIYGYNQLDKITVATGNPSFQVVNGCLYSKDMTRLIRVPVSFSGTYSTPGSVKWYNSDCFTNCDQIEEIVCSDWISSLYGHFQGCTNLFCVEVPDNCSLICNGAFNDCQSLISLSFPDSVDEIRSDCFKNCPNLSRMYFYSDSTIIYDSADTLPEHTVIYGYVGSTAEEYAQKYGREFHPLPSASGKCGEYGDYVYWEYLSDTRELRIFGKGKMENLFVGVSPWYAYRDDITAVIVEEGVENLSRSSLYQLRYVGQIFLPASLTAIENGGLPRSEFLERITLAEGNQSFILMNEVLYSSDLKVLYKVPRMYVGAFEIPDTVKTVFEYAFYHCSSISSIMIPNSTTTIMNGAFADCTALKYIMLPQYLSEIAEYTFSNCNRLEVVEFSGQINTIEHLAFQNCDALTAIVLPKSLRIIEDSAFYGCSMLQCVDIPSGCVDIGKDAFYRCDQMTDVYIRSKNVTIDQSSQVFPEKAKIYGYLGSTAEAYAKTFDRVFQPLQEES